MDSPVKSVSPHLPLRPLPPTSSLTPFNGVFENKHCPLLSSPHPPLHSVSPLGQEKGILTGIRPSSSSSSFFFSACVSYWTVGENLVLFAKAWQSLPVILLVDLSRFLAGWEAVAGRSRDEESGIWKERGGGGGGAASSLGLFNSCFNCILTVIWRSELSWRLTVFAQSCHSLSPCVSRK